MNSFLIFLSAIAVTGCASFRNFGASSEERHKDTEIAWAKISSNIRERDEEAALANIDELLSTEILVRRDGNSNKKTNGSGTFEYRIIPALDFKRSISQIISILVECDSGIKKSDWNIIKKRTSNDSYLISTISNSYVGAFPQSFPLDAKQLTEKFDAYDKKFAHEQQVKLERARLAALKAEEDEKKQIAEQKKAEERKEKDPQTWSERACNSQKIINLSKDTIKREQAGAKYSGVVNQSTLYGAGQTIELMQEQQTKQKAEYRKLSGKEWSAKDCE